MRLTPTKKGYLFTLLATIAFSNIYIFSKAALNEIPLSVFGFYWFAIGLFLNLILVISKGSLALLRQLPSKELWILPVLGILEILTTSTFFLAIHIIPNPTITSFLGNLFPIHTTLLGIIFLKERFTIYESMGVLLILVGAFITSLTGEASFSDFFVPGTGIVIINGLLAAITTIVVKTRVKIMSPDLLSFNRTFWLFLSAVIWIFFSDASLTIPASAITNIAIGAILGPFFALWFIYAGLKYIEVSRATIIQSLKGVVVMIGAYLYWQILPLPHQLLGGLISIAGIIVLVAAQRRLQKKLS